MGFIFGFFIILIGIESLLYRNFFIGVIRFVIRIKIISSIYGDVVFIIFMFFLIFLFFFVKWFELYIFLLRSLSIVIMISIMRIFVKMLVIIGVFIKIVSFVVV